MTLKKGKILIIDDNARILDSLKLLLKNEYEHIACIRNPNLIPEKLRTEEFDVIMLDMNFAAGRTTGNEGIFWLREILKSDALAVVILITAFGDIELAVKGIKEGATDFIQKPWDTDKLLSTLNTAYQLRRSKVELNEIKRKHEFINKDTLRNNDIYYGSSEVIQQLLKTIDKVACTDAGILITGENGTGKELIAREIHHRSSRSREIFVGVDLGSLTETLFESEMFGHIKGAFTDAKEDRIGRFEAAAGGTLFLDEIGNLSHGLQSKLLTAIQNKQVSKIGSQKIIPVDVRLICATNKNIPEMITNGLFREDLFYRINTIQIEMPPLKERKEDIPGFADFFLKQFSIKYEKYGLKISNKGYEALLCYKWPGNIRELKHTIEKAVILAESDVLNQGDFYLSHQKNQADIPSNSMKLADIEAKAIFEVIKECRGNLTKAAQILEISRTTLYSKIEKYKLY